MQSKVCIDNEGRKKNQVTINPEGRNQAVVLAYGNMSRMAMRHLNRMMHTFEKADHLYGLFSLFHSDLKQRNAVLKFFPRLSLSLNILPLLCELLPKSQLFYDCALNAEREPCFSLIFFFLTRIQHGKYICTGLVPQVLNSLIAERDLAVRGAPQMWRSTV